MRKRPFSKYPRTFETDLDLCRTEGVGLVFAPSAADIYPTGDCTRVRVSGLTEALCGLSRPGHFDGVTTIVTKLFILSRPSKAFFGRKDYQQLQVVRRMTTDLLLPIEIVGCPIVREADGLALSSRNRYLNTDERQRALGIIRGLVAADRAYRRGERDIAALCRLVEGSLEQAGLRKDYVEFRGAEHLEAESLVLPTVGETVLAVAAFCGNTRLIDNVVLGVDALPVIDAELIGEK